MTRLEHVNIDSNVFYPWRVQQNGEAPYGDATKEWMLKHIAQLKPIFTEFEDVIDVVQAGFIGVWGASSPPSTELFVLLKLLEIYLN